MWQTMVFMGQMRCGNSVPIVGRLSRPYNDRVVVLQRRIKWIEDHYYRHHPGGNANAKDEDQDLKAPRQALTALLEEDAKADNFMIRSVAFSNLDTIRCVQV
jgi:hypothetical protein